MSKPVLLSLGAGKVQELAGTNDNDVLTWDSATSEWKAEAGGGGGSGTVTSVGLTGGTSGIVIGGTASPITGAGTYNLDAPQRFAFDTTSPIAPTSPGQISWNATEGSLNTLMAGGNVDAVVGQQLYQRAVNNDTVTLTKGMVVYVDGSSGTRASVKRATADADLSSATILGVVAESIAQNAEGFIITNGLLKDLTVLPSTTFADGDVVYLSPTTAGGLTPTKPTAPQHLVMVGYCVKASNGAAGVLLVHPQNGYELGELHDVYINNPTSGQILIYDATTGQTRWENASLTGGTGVTVTPGPGSLSVAIGQAVGTSDSPSFTGLTLSGLSNGLVRVTSGVLAGAATVVGSDFGSQTANTVLAAPDGSAGNPSFRALVAADIPSLSSVYLPLSGGTLTGKLTTVASATGSAGLNLPHGAAPTSPVNGDLWTTTSAMFLRVNGGTQQFPFLASANTFSATNVFSASSGSFVTGGFSGTTNVSTGPTPSGSTKTVNIGTGAAAGSTTTITIGATAGTSTTTLNGTVSLANALAVGSGGTGATTLTQYGVLVGNATSAIAATAVGTSGQYLKSGAGAANPAFATIAVAEVTGAAPLASPTFTGTVTLPLSTAGYVKTTSGGVISSSATVPTSDLSGSIALGSQVSGTLPVANGGTNNASLSVTQGTVYYGDGTKLVGLAPGTSGQFLQTQGAGANPQWASAGSATTPYDLSGEFVGTPASGATIMRFVAARSFTFGGTAYFVCTSNTGATTAVFTVNVNGVSKGTVSIAGNATSGTGTITSTSIAAGDLVSVVATTPANVINPYWTLPGTV